jgi:hypothetical protein
MPRLSSQACPRNPPSSPLVIPTWRWAGWSCWVSSTWAAKAWARQVDFGTYRLILVTAHVSWSTEKRPPPLRRPMGATGARASCATTYRTTRYGSSRKPTLIPPSRSAAWINSRRSAAGRRKNFCRALTPIYATPSLLGALSPAHSLKTAEAISFPLPSPRFAYAPIPRTILKIQLTIIVWIATWFGFDAHGASSPGPAAPRPRPLGRSDAVEPCSPSPQLYHSGGYRRRSTARRKPL